jgi:hypothetical protein
MPLQHNERLSGFIRVIGHVPAKQAMYTQCILRETLHSRSFYLFKKPSSIKENCIRYKYKETQQLSALFCVLLQVQVNSNKQSRADFGNQRRRSIILATGSVVKQHHAQICGYSQTYSLTTHYF